MQQRAYILVEGYGEVDAVANLLSRLSLDLEFHLPWSKPLRWTNLHQWENHRGKGGIRKGAEYVRRRDDAGALLILRDEDDACPKELAPQMAERLKELSLPFPVAYVLLHPEYEVLFLPCVHLMTGDMPDGRPGLQEGTRWEGNWEHRRGVKEWLSRHFPKGRSYKPTLDQLPLTRKIDLETLRGAEVPSFGSLERGIRRLGATLNQEGAVYPLSPSQR